MNKMTVVQLKTGKITAVLNEAYSLLIMFASYIIGVIIGAVLIKTSDRALLKAEALYSSFINVRTNKSFSSIFGAAIMEWLPFMLILFVCGTCIVGMVIMPIFICYKGFCYGALAGYIYSCFAFSGIVFVLLLIIPGTLIGAFGLFLAGKRSFSFSLILAKSVLPRSREYSMYNVLTHYCKEFVYLLLVAFLAALTDAALSAAFWDKINLH